MLSTFRVAWQGVKGYLGRNALTTLGLSLGLLAFVTVTSASVALQAVIEQRELLLNGPRTTTTVAFDAATRSDVARSFQGRIAGYFGHDTEASITVASSGLTLSTAGGLAIPEVVITDERLIAVRPFPIVAGTWLNSTVHVAPRVVLNSTAAANAHFNRDVWVLNGPHGLHVSSVVLGVVEDGEDRPIAYVSLDDVERWGWTPSTTANISLKVTGSSASTSSIRSLNASYDSLGPSTGVQSVERTDSMERIAQEVEATRSIFSVVIAFSLLGTVIGISNVGFASVKERAHELSLRRALGSTRMNIFAVILIESQIVAIGSWMLAMGISVACYPQVAIAFGVPPGIALPAYPLSAASFGLLLGSGSALLGALAPAFRASKANLSAVMRA